MKKIISVILTVVMMLCVAIPVLAYESNENPGAEFKVSVFTTLGGTVRYYSDSDGNVIFVAKPYNGHEFSGWKIEGDYVIVKGSLDTLEITVKPEGDIKTVATFDGNTEPVKEWQGDESPKTGYSAVPAVILAATSLFGCAYCAKRSRKG